MKYLQKYFPFIEGAETKSYRVDPFSGDKKRSLEFYNSTKNYLEHSPAMLDIIALYPDKNPNDIYKLEKSGHITFRRAFGQINTITYQDNKFTFNSWNQSTVTSKTYETLEECLRNFWAYLVGMKILMMKDANMYNIEITRKLLSDTNTKLFWGEKLSMETILDNFKGINNKDNSITYYMNHLFHNVGITFEPISNGIKSSTIYTNKDNTLINAFVQSVVPNIYHFAKAGYVTKEPDIIISTEGDKEKFLNYIIRPRTKEEFVIQILQKIYKAYKSFGENLEITFKKKNKKCPTLPYIRDFIKIYSKLLIKDIEEYGIDFEKNERLLTLIHETLSLMPNSFKAINMVEKNTPELWSQLNDVGSSLTTASKLGEIGF